MEMERLKSEIECYCGKKNGDAGRRQNGLKKVGKEYDIR